MVLFIAFLALLATAAVTATVRSLIRDGYRRQPCRDQAAVRRVHLPFTTR